MKLTMLDTEGSPFYQLKTKAAETKDLGQPLLSVWRSRYADNSDSVHRGITRLLELSVLIESTVRDNSHRLFYPQNLTDDLFRTCAEYDQVTTFLGNEFHERGLRCLWHQPCFHAALGKHASQTCFPNMSHATCSPVAYMCAPCCARVGISTTP